MSMYKCCFKQDVDYAEGIEQDPDWVEVKTYDPEEAAKEFSEYAFHRRDMYEVSSPWGEDKGDEYNVVVEDAEGNRTEWAISYEFEPVFRALKRGG